ncbi:MAG: FkbM family methyltransferase [Bacteroidota bacterium]
MEKKLRALLLKMLGTERYLSLVSRIYISMIKGGMMKAKYPELFYLQELIHPGFICIDVGANVGYYSTVLSRLCGAMGHVHAVEPVQLFQSVFNSNMRAFKCNNVTLHPVALGGETSTITMGTPVLDGVFRHGLTHVVEANEDTTGMHTYSVNMRRPDDLFASLQRVDFMKCDVEGYEVFLMPHFTNLIARFKPLIQIEISSADNRESIMQLFAPFGYQPYKLSAGGLVKMTGAEAVGYDNGDFYFKAG